MALSALLDLTSALLMGLGFGAGLMAGVTAAAWAIGYWLRD